MLKIIYQEVMIINGVLPSRVELSGDENHDLLC